VPELPEVETSRKGIEPYIKQQPIETVIVRQSKLRYPIPPEISTLLPGLIIESVKRRGKYLLLSTELGTVIIHLGMSGHLRIVDKETPAEKHAHVDFVFSNNKALRFVDPRRFGLIDWTDRPVEQHRLISRLGVEPLSDHFTGQYLYDVWQRKFQAIKPALMDSHTVVGLGNIYATETLYLAKIHPQKPASTLSLKQCDLIAQFGKEVLTKAIESGGTTLNDFYSSTGKPGYFSQQLQVYGRDGEFCYACGSTIEKIRQLQRSSYFCPECQPIF